MKLSVRPLCVCVRSSKEYLSLLEKRGRERGKMVLDSIIVVNDFYCNVEAVEANAINQLVALSPTNSETTATTRGGNMNVASMQDSFQHHLAFKIKDFAESVGEIGGNGCFTRNFDDCHDMSQKSNWTGALFLGFTPKVTGGQSSGANSNNERAVLKIGSVNDGAAATVVLPLAKNRLVLWRSQNRLAGVSIIDGGSNDAVFQLFFFNTHNYNYIGRDMHRLGPIAHLQGAKRRVKCGQVRRIH